MRVTVQYFDGCPHWAEMAERIQQAVLQLGRRDVSVDYRTITTPEEAGAERSRGSPTVLLNGRDPFGEPDRQVWLSCRVYRTPAGPAGAPTVEQLVEVLRTGDGASSRR